MGENRKPIRCVPNRCSKNSNTKIAADTQVTTAAPQIYSFQNIKLQAVSLICNTIECNQCELSPDDLMKNLSTLTSKKFRRKP